MIQINVKIWSLYGLGEFEGHRLEMHRSAPGYDWLSDTTSAIVVNVSLLVSTLVIASTRLKSYNQPDAKLWIARCNDDLLILPLDSATLLEGIEVLRTVTNHDVFKKDCTGLFAEPGTNSGRSAMERWLLVRRVPKAGRRCPVRWNPSSSRSVKKMGKLGATCVRPLPKL